MDSNRFDMLLDSYVAAEATPAETAELERLLVSDAALRRQLAERFLLEVHLHKAFATIPAGLPSEATPRLRSHRRLIGWLVAALVLVAVGIGAVAWLKIGNPVPPPTSNGNWVVGGDVRVDGVAVKQLPEERWFEVVGDAPAQLKLADGSGVEVAPDSRAILHGRHDAVRQAVELERGGGKFNVATGGGQFRVETAAGNVTVLGTAFTVKLEARGKGDKRPGRARATMIVAVTEGSVKVESAGKSYVLAAGDRRVFPERKRDDDDDGRRGRDD